jgi:polyisoprenoid-binding protein YceI
MPALIPVKTFGFLCVSLVCLSGCNSLAGLPIVQAAITPNVETGQAALKPGNYALDPAHAYLSFSVEHQGLSELKGRFDKFDVSLSFDEASPEAASLDVRIDVNSLFLSTPEFSETLKGKDWFNAATFPDARFKSTKVDVTGDNNGRVTGTLTLNGKTHPVTLIVKFNGGAMIPITGKYTVGFDATGSFNRSDFGLGKYTPLVSDNVRLSFSGEFQKTD